MLVSWPPLSEGKTKRKKNGLSIGVVRRQASGCPRTLWPPPPYKTRTRCETCHDATAPLAGKAVVPRILIACGHTFCEDCLAQILRCANPPHAHPRGPDLLPPAAATCDVEKRNME
jgi:hypothetical protein